MPLEANSEHVVAFPLKPIRRAVDVVHAVDLERRPLRKLRFDAEKTAEWKRPEVPDYLYRNLGVPVLDGSDVAQEIVALRLIVVQPPNHLLHRHRIHINDRLPPDHFHAFDRRRELLLECRRRRVSRLLPVRDVLLGNGSAVARARTGANDLESAHWADLVWFTELPKGSPSSSITDGGM